MDERLPDLYSPFDHHLYFDPRIYWKIRFPGKLSSSAALSDLSAVSDYTGKNGKEKRINYNWGRSKVKLYYVPSYIYPWVKLRNTPGKNVNIFKLLFHSYTEYIVFPNLLKYLIQEEIVSLYRSNNILLWVVLEEFHLENATVEFRTKLCISEEYHF